MSNDTSLVFRLAADNKKLETDLKRAKGQLNRFKGQSKGISGAISRNLGSMFGVFTAGLIVRDVFNTVTQFEKQMDKVQAISGATEKEILKLKKSAIELGKASKFTATEIGQLQEELARLGFSSTEIRDSTDAIRKLATAADSDLGEAAKVLASTLNAFNMEAQYSEEVANIMAESFSKSALDIEKFATGMANVGATANAAGVSLSQTTAMLGILNNAGIDASKAGTDLRKIFTELSLKGITLDDALDQIQGSTDKVKTAFELFGQRASTSAILLAENEQGFKDLNDELGDTNQELNDMVDTMEGNLLTDLDKLKSAWDGVFHSIEDGSGKGNELLRQMTQYVTELLNAFSGDTRAQASLKGYADIFDIGFEFAENAIKEFIGLADEQERLTELSEAYEEQLKSVSNAADRFTLLGRLEAVRKRQEDLTDETEKANKAFQDLDKNFNQFINSAGKADENLNKLGETMQEFLERMKVLARDRSLQNYLKEISELAFEFDYEGLKKAFTPEVEDKGLTDETDSLIFDLFPSDEEIDEASQRFIDSMSDAYNNAKNELKTLADGINSILQDMAIDIMVAIGNGIGTGAGIEAIFGNVINIIAEAMQKIGALMITYGVLKLAFINGVTTLNPFVAIAAGTAMVAAGAAIKKANSNFGSDLGGGGGGTSGRGPSDSFNLSGQSIRISGEFMVKGKDLVYVIGEQNRDFNRTQG